MSGKITYIEDASSSYVPRTKRNAQEAELTICFDVSLNSSGTKLTKKATLEASNIFYLFQLTNGINYNTTAKVKEVVELILKHNIKTINIAGNGLSTLSSTVFDQKLCDDYTLIFIHDIYHDLKAKDYFLESIRTGGQTGFDEAGAKAAIKMGIDTIIHFPKGWRFRPAVGKDIYDQELFRKRFENGAE